MRSRHAFVPVRLFLLAAAAVIVSAVAGCDKNHTTTMPPTPSPTTGFGVTISGVLPASIVASSAVQTITVAGTNFQAGVKLGVTFSVGNNTTLTMVDSISSTSTSFQANVIFASAGVYGLMAMNPDLTSSGPFMVAVK